jgi:ribosomal protein L14E/L6E/L27E
MIGAKTEIFMHDWVSTQHEGQKKVKIKNLELGIVMLNAPKDKKYEPITPINVKIKEPIPEILEAPTRRKFEELIPEISEAPKPAALEAELKQASPVMTINEGVYRLLKKQQDRALKEIKERKKARALKETDPDIKAALQKLIKKQNTRALKELKELF